MGQWYCHTDGQKYGPVSFEELQQWGKEDRIKPTDNVWTEGMENWTPARTIPGLCYNVPPPAPPEAIDELSELTGALDGRDSQSPDLPPPTVTYKRAKTFKRPHRGATVLVFGILSWVLCFIFGIIAWVMGSGDLRAMREGMMDRSGESITRVGQLLGMISVILSIIGIPAYLYLKLSNLAD
ncbi:MAG: DUF4339 domain-containing protein [Planctomycetes bacterium]|nr:DUF4339 domain-containing protein [Planctomycetota bacterium]